MAMIWGEDKYKGFKMDDSHKYFIPDIEDLRVGYECEYHSKSQLGWIKLMVHDYHFRTKIPKGYTGISIFNISEYLRQDNWIRTPYLTKEQIEAEGWKINPDIHMLNGNAFKKDEWELEWTGKYIKIWKPNQFGIYKGECKSINEFKTLMKWLKL